MLLRTYSNSFIGGQSSYYSLIWMLTSIRCYREINKLYERSLRLRRNEYTLAYDKLFSKQSLVNIYITNIQRLTVETVKCLEGLSSPIVNEISMLRTTPYSKRNPSDLHNQFWQRSFIVEQKLKTT